MKLEGWAITAWIAGLILLALLILFGLSGWSPTTITSGIDATGRCSLLLFSVAFTASSLHRLWRVPLTTWTLLNRRWIGLGFASSHFIHLALILSMSLAFPEPFLSRQSMGQWIFGGIGYGFVFLMAVTSSDRAQHWMGMKSWKRLHLTGSYWLWTVFLFTYIKHVKQGPDWLYLPLLLFTIALLPIRLAKQIPPRPSLGAAS